MVHIESGEDTDDFASRWHELVEIPAREAGMPVPELVILKSNYRFVIRPIVAYAVELERTNPDREVAVLLGELVENRWYYTLLHNNRAEVLRAGKRLIFTEAEVMIERDNKRLIVAKASSTLAVIS